MAKVTALTSDSDELETTYTITVTRNLLADSPDVQDLPADIHTAIQGWLLSHYRQRIMMGVDEEIKPEDTRGNDGIKPIEAFLSTGELRCSNRVPGLSVQCAARRGHIGSCWSGHTSTPKPREPKLGDWGQNPWHQP